MQKSPYEGEFIPHWSGAESLLLSLPSEVSEAEMSEAEVERLAAESRLDSASG